MVGRGMISLAGTRSLAAGARLDATQIQRPWRRSCSRPRAFGIDMTQFEGALDESTSYSSLLQSALELLTTLSKICLVVYGGLGLAATSFLATFFVAPKFRSELKEPEDWKDIYAQLVSRETQSITPLSAAAKLSNSKCVLLDVSLTSRFEKKSAKGSINIPLYQPIEGWDLPSTARRVGFAFFGIPGTERNPQWLEAVESTIPKDEEIIVLCELGGTLEKKTGMDTGFQSRSLKAVHFLQEAGYQNVLHLKGGINEWIREGLPLSESSAN